MKEQQVQWELGFSKSGRLYFLGTGSRQLWAPIGPGGDGVLIRYIHSCPAAIYFPIRCYVSSYFNWKLNLTLLRVCACAGTCVRSFFPTNPWLTEKSQVSPQKFVFSGRIIYHLKIFLVSLSLPENNDLSIPINVSTKVIRKKKSYDWLSLWAFSFCDKGTSLLL